MAFWPNGFAIEIDSVEPRRVVPAANVQRELDSVAHGVEAEASPLVAVCSTTIPAPNASTTIDASRLRVRSLNATRSLP